jgi:hypothetical protein
MHALTTSFASTSPQSSPAYLAHEGARRSRQALEAVDAYLRRDSTYSAPRVAGSWMSLLLDGLVEKLLK